MLEKSLQYGLTGKLVRLLLFFFLIYDVSVISNIASINRIYHRSPMQTEKSQPEGKRIMLEIRFTEFPALSVDRRVGISRSASETDV